MRSLGRLGVVLGALVLLAATRLLVRVGGSDASAEPLVVITPHWEGIRYEFERAFVREMAAKGRHVRIQWQIPGGTSACLRYVRSRFQSLPEGIGVDLFFGGGVEPFLALADSGLIAPLQIPPETLAALPATVAGVPIYDAAAGWYGTCLTTFGVVYNKELLRRLGLPEPRSFGDLGEPRMRSWVGLADLRMSGTVHMIYELLLQAHGWDEGYRLIARAAANSRRFYHHAAEVPIEVGAGDIALGATIDSYAWAQVEQLGKESVGFVAPPAESVMNPDAIAVIKGAPHAELARAFVAFTLSPQGQALWMLPRGVKDGPERYVLGRMPVRPDVWQARRAESTMSLDPFAPRPAVAYDPALGSARWSVVNGAIGAALIDLHRELVSAWEDVAAAGFPAEAVETLTRPPVSAAETLRLAAGDFRDPILRNQVLARWSREASARYQAARTIAARTTARTRRRGTS